MNPIPLAGSNPVTQPDSSSASGWMADWGFGLGYTRSAALPSEQLLLASKQPAWGFSRDDGNAGDSIGDVLPDCRAVDGPIHSTNRDWGSAAAWFTGKRPADTRDTAAVGSDAATTCGKT